MHDEINAVRLFAEGDAEQITTRCANGVPQYLNFSKLQIQAPDSSIQNYHLIEPKLEWVIAGGLAFSLQATNL